ncbi:MAG: flagellar biosynthesis anti-sigma factor FlgM [Xanthomonadaceae bacterium]|nr:flagellar biosynthesis anti-sigma factor FlgM [Xanthomonadaceae bacterium]
MKVSQNVNSGVRSTETSQTKKSEAPLKSIGAESARAPIKTEISGSYNADISDKAKDMALARKTAEGAGDIREAKITELKRRIANKEYNVKSDAIADKLVSDHLENPGL